MKEIWLLAREMEGWAEAGGIKDVVRDQAQAFADLGWNTQVVLPLYGFLKTRVLDTATKLWSGISKHPEFLGHPIEWWSLASGRLTVNFVRLPSFEDKQGIYTYSLTDEVPGKGMAKGSGFLDGMPMNLEYQWAITQFWYETHTVPRYVLGHDGHLGFLAAISRCHPEYGQTFRSTRFALLIHNAGPVYRQEMADSPSHRRLINLPEAVVKQSLLEGALDPIVSSSLHADLSTVSENYAQELLTGRNDHWSGAFGRYLRENRVPLRGINNGIGMADKDPRDPESAGLPVGFDPLKGEWRGKQICRAILRERILLKPSQTYGRIQRWERALYISQGRLTTQKGIDALAELIDRALSETEGSVFIVMAQGEKRYEERMIWLARNHSDTGRFLFINKYEDALARLLFAAGDFLLVPSEYEPCGLTDLKAQLMGTLPIVHRVGGLVKVKHGVTGFSYAKAERPGLWGVYRSTLDLHQNHQNQLEVMRHTAFRSVLDNSNWKNILESHYIPWLTESPVNPIVAVLPT